MPASSSEPQPPIEVKVLFFSTLRELTGQSELAQSLCPPLSVGDLWSQLKTEYPALSAWDERVLIAVNLEYAGLQTALADGDEVAFMPPVQGG